MGDGAWDSFCPPASWYDKRYIEVQFDRYMPSADRLIGRTLTEQDVKEYKLPESYIGKIVETVSYPLG